MAGHPNDLAPSAEHSSFLNLKDKIDQALKLKEQPQSAKPKPADNSAAKKSAKPKPKPKPKPKAPEVDSAAKQSPKPKHKPEDDSAAKPNTAPKRKPEDDSAAKQGPSKKQQRQKPGHNPSRPEKPGPKPPRTEKPRENGAQNHPEPKSVSEDAILNEIRTLGGDENDLDLIMGAASDSENEYDDSSAPLSQKMRSELAKFADQLGFSKVEVQDEPEDGEDASDADAESKAPAPADVKKGATIFETRADWHGEPLKPLPSQRSEDVASYRAAIHSLGEHARKLLEDDSHSYAKTFQASSTHKFLSTIMSSGTMNDKTSALTLAVQESPVHNVRALEALLSLASKKNRSQAIIALAAVVDLMGPGLVLPPGRRLRAFHQQPGLIGALQKAEATSWDSSKKLPGGLTGTHLIVWAYEDWLKTTYFKVIQLLEVWCADEIEYSRTRALDFIFGLLKEKPEQEANLLRLIVNRLGDRDRKLSSRSSHLLLQLQSTHPGMKDVIIQTIEHEIILKPGQALRARYYAINTLNQTILSSREASVSTALLKIYFGMFAGMLKSGEMASASQSQPSEVSSTGNKSKYKQQKPTAEKTNEGDLAEKVVSQILVGINRAVPFSEENDPMLEAQMDTLFKIAHSSNFNTGIQAMLLIQQLVATKSFSSDRFYRVLYESLLDPRLPASSKHAMYLNLLLRSLKSDVNTKRVKAFVKRMLQGLSLHQPPFVCGVLYVLSQLRKSLPGLLTLIEEPEEHPEGQADSGELEQGGSGGPAVDRSQQYDGRKRDPEYSNAHNTCLWEIVPTLHHYHPAVLVYASSVMGSDAKIEKPDLESHSLIRFLDKFAYRNTKTKEETRGGSIMQPLQSTKSGSDQILRSKGASGVSVNTASFWTKKVENVAAEDAFFHEYFSQIGRTNSARRAAPEQEADRAEQHENEIWKALTSGQGEAGDEEADMGDDLEGDMADEEESEGEMPDWDSSSDDSDGGADVAVEDGEGEGEDEFMAAGGSDSEGDAEAKGGADDGDKKEDKKEDNSKAAQRKARKKQLRDLPMFASAEDYAELLAGGDDDDDEDMG